MAPAAYALRERFERKREEVGQRGLEGAPNVAIGLVDLLGSTQTHFEAHGR